MREAIILTYLVFVGGAVVLYRIQVTKELVDGVVLTVAGAVVSYISPQNAEAVRRDNYESAIRATERVFFVGVVDEQGASAIQSFIEHNLLLHRVAITQELLGALKVREIKMRHLII